MNVHELDTWPAYFTQIKAGTKRFELRKYNRKFKVGDFLKLKEYRITDVNNTDSPGEYTGNEITVEVTSILYDIEGVHFGLQRGYCIMSIRIKE